LSRVKGKVILPGEAVYREVTAISGWYRENNPFAPGSEQFHCQGEGIIFLKVLLSEGVVTAVETEVKIKNKEWFREDKINLKLMTGED